MQRGSSISVTCPLCNVAMNSLATYIHHLQDVHKKMQSELHCPFCSKVFKKNSLYVHIRSCSRSKSVQSMCRRCQILIDSDQLTAHFKSHVMKQEYFICPYQNCTFSFGGKSNNATRVMKHFQTHCSELHHSGVLENEEDLYSMREEQLIREGRDILDNDDSDDPDEPDYWREYDEERVEEETAQRKAFEDKFWALWLTTCFVKLIPANVMNELISTMSDLAVESKRNLLSKLKNKIPEKHKEVEDIFETEDWLTDCLTNPYLKSHFKRVKKADSFIEYSIPQSITSLINCQYSTSCNSLKLNVKEVVQQELEYSNWDPDKNFGLPEDFDYIQNMKTRDPELLCSFRDGERYKDVISDVPLEQQPPVLLQLYADALDRDSMGFTSGRNKIHVTCIRNVGLHDGQPRSPDQYKLIQLINENVKAVYSYEEIMKPLVDDIKQLVEDGIFYRGRHHAVRLVHLQGDGKERAAMYGMCDSFSAVSHCDPWSYLTRTTRINAKNVDEVIREANKCRTVSSYELDVRNIGGRIKHAKRLKEKKRKLKRLSKEAKAIDKAGGSNNSATVTRRNVGKLESKYSYSRGLKYCSPWNDVPFFHVAHPGALVPCSSHDLYAGAF